MKLLKLAEVETTSRERVFSYSRVHAAALGVVAVSAIAAVIFRANTMHWKAGYYLAGVFFLFLAVTQRFITARFRPTNWLVRMNDAGLYVQFRSYLNYHLPANDLTVAFLGYQEIRSARLVRERARVSDSDGNPTTQTFRYIELELSPGQTAALEKALQHEIAERAPSEKRWYGTTTTLYEDYPVRMTVPPFLRIRWQATPNAQKFLEALRQNVAIAEPVLIQQDFVNMQGLDRDEQQKRLAELAQRGETITAIYTARRLYGCGLEEAQRMIGDLKVGRGANA